MGARPYLALSRFELARVLQRRAAGVDLEQAVAECNQALGTAREVAMEPLMKKAVALKLEIQGGSSEDRTLSLDSG